MHKVHVCEVDLLFACWVVCVEKYPLFGVGVGMNVFFLGLRGLVCLYCVNA